MTVCEKCGAYCADDDTFCPYCGNELNKKPKPVTVNRAYCPKCGAAVDETDDFCRKCGSRIKGYSANQQSSYNYHSNSQPTTTTEKDKGIKGGGAGFALTFFLGLIGLVICLAAGDDECKKASVITFAICFGLSILLFGCVGALY